VRFSSSIIYFILSAFETDSEKKNICIITRLSTNRQTTGSSQGFFLLLHLSLMSCTGPLLNFQAISMSINLLGKVKVSIDQLQTVN